MKKTLIAALLAIAVVRPAVSTELLTIGTGVDGYMQQWLGQQTALKSGMGLKFTAKDVGVGLTPDDTQKWTGDKSNVTYISPRLTGVQVGVSSGKPDGHDAAVWTTGIDFKQAVGDTGFGVSLGRSAAGRTRCGPVCPPPPPPPCPPCPPIGCLPLETEADARIATPFSAGYMLGPGVSKRSIFQVGNASIMLGAANQISGSYGGGDGLNLGANWGQ